jgi:indolepyruvate ferredoxin oxidoreductase
MLVAGIGGTGVITIGALVGMAAHLEGKGCSVLDVTGLSQKNGPVTSHVRVAARPDALHATRIAAGRANLVLGCDIVVTTGSEALGSMGHGHTTAVVNSHVAPTAEFANDPDLDFSSRGMEETIRGAAGDASHFLPATQLATALLGDAIATNLFLVGYAFQRGRLPVGLGALERALELNGRAVAMNKRAFAWGRLYAHDPKAVERAARPGLRAEVAAAEDPGLDALVARRVELLTAYQNRSYAARYRERVERVVAREGELVPGSTALAEAVARYYAKLLAYKDEYEVARLYTNGEFLEELNTQLEGEFRVELHLAPPLLARRDAATGRPRKRAFGPWLLHALKLLARCKGLRGTLFDPFGYTRERRAERRLIGEYEHTLQELRESLSPGNHALAVQIAALPQQIRGFGDVKRASCERVKRQEKALLDRFLKREHARVDEPDGEAFGGASGIEHL